MKKLLFILIVFLAVSTALADEDEYYIICNPSSRVNVHLAANKASEEIGWVECGDIVWSDGKKRNGFLHCFLNIEAGEGWIYAKYLVDEKPIRYGGTAVVQSNGRVACRQYINGKRQGWLKPGQKVTVLAYTSEWALTKKGFVQVRFLEFEQ